MSSAAERAAARRAALLNRGGDRLNKLATSARGEEASYLREDRPLAPSLSTFLGEDATSSVPPTPPRPLSFRAESPGPSTPAMRATRDARSPSPFANPLSPPRYDRHESPVPEMFSPDMQLPPQLAQLLASGGFPGVGGPGGAENPLAALLGAGLMPPGMMPPGIDGAEQMPGAAPFEPPRPKSLWERLTPLLHLIAVIVLVLYATYSQSVHHTSTEQRASAWRNLSTKPDEQEVAVLPTSFFWIFLTMQIMLHSLRIFSRHDAALPGLLSMVLPFAPPQLQTIVINGARYYAMLGMLLDDLAVLIFTLGVVVWLNSL
ncbi:hypothetical protein BKA62DRAFT_693446 [Auriculariales sp. MPI-PUGE-AT-0066]|nr:hypothetical protein BKA62DRAFT_693446 [Auriculariales sp. MPI-PUGE-AT-0066]